MGKERGEAGVDALDLHASGERLGLSVAGATVEEDGGRVAPRQLGGQVAVEEMRGEQRVIDMPQAL